MHNAMYLKVFILHDLDQTRSDENRFKVYKFIIHLFDFGQEDFR